MIEDATNTIN